MKLTRALRQELEQSLRYARRSKEYLERTDVEVCRTFKPNTGPVGILFTDKDGNGLLPMQKWCGSELAMLPDVIRILERVLTAN